MKPHFVTKELAVRAVVLFGTIIFCLGIMELGLRAIGRAPSTASEDFFEEWGNSYKMKKNLTKTIRWPAYTYTIHTNAFGFRDNGIDAPKFDDHKYYVFLGSSDAFGQGVDYEKTFVGFLADSASSRGIRVYNMSVGGHHLVTQVSFFKEFLQKVQKKPSKVFLCVNALTIANFDRRNDDIIVRNGSLFPKEGYMLAYVKYSIQNISSSFNFFREVVRRFQSKWMGFDPKHDSMEFFTTYSRQNRMHIDDNIAKLYNHFEEFEGYFSQNGIQVIYVYLPMIDSYRIGQIAIKLGLNPDNYDPLYYENLMEEYCGRRKIRLLNLGPILKRHFDEGKELRFPLDAHYNDFSHQVVGDYLATNIFLSQN